MRKTRSLLLASLLGIAVLLTSINASAALVHAAKGADDVVGKFGVGYTSTNAPLGIRMWFSEMLGFDAGFGIVFNGEERQPNDTDTQTTTDWALDAGFLIALVKGENSILFARIGLNLDRRYAMGRDNTQAGGPETDSSIITFTIGGLLGMELFMSALGFPELSLQGAVGLGYFNTSGPEVKPGADDKNWALGSLTTGLSLVGTAQLGFHYYF